MQAHTVPCDPVAKFGSVQKVHAVKALKQSLVELRTAVVESQTSDQFGNLLRGVPQELLDRLQNDAGQTETEVAIVGAEDHGRRSRRTQLTRPKGRKESLVE